MQVKHDPQNSLFDTIDNALRGAMRSTLAQKTPSMVWTPSEQEFFMVATRMVMDALGISDVPPEGVWVVYYSDDSDSAVHSVHMNELDALRISQKNGYYMPAKFMKFGEEK